MTFIDKKTKLADVISDNHQIIPVVNRFGIHLGVGEKTMEEISAESACNLEFLLAILNTYVDDDFFPEKKLKHFDIMEIISYLQKADSYTINIQLLNLEKHLKAFISMSNPNNKQLLLINKLFDEFKKVLDENMDAGMIVNGVHALEVLIELKNILIRHISGDFNENMCYAVIFSIDSIQRDLQQHNLIREKILYPMIEDLKASGLIGNWKDLLHKSYKITHENDKETLSARELDVLRLVALGFINKEVADRLNISLNTVLTHRKNIASKLGIKTVSGWVFYCISNNYISADDIEF